MSEGEGTTQHPAGAPPRVDALGPQDLDAALEHEVFVLACASPGLGPSGLRVLTLGWEGRALAAHGCQVTSMADAVQGRVLSREGPALPVDQQFDVVVCGCDGPLSLEVEFLRGLHRALVAGGRLVLAASTAHGHPGAVEGALRPAGLRALALLCRSAGLEVDVVKLHDTAIIVLGHRPAERVGPC